MSVMDKLKDMLKGHPDQTSKGVDKAGDYIDEKTHGKYHGQVDSAQKKAKDKLGGGKNQEPPQR